MPTVSVPLRERLLRGATEVIVDRGWGAVTMEAVALHVGVSRRTVYNEIGTKPQLAEALAVYELGHFLRVVDAAFDAEPEDLVAGIRRSCGEVLRLAERSPLLRAVIGSAQGAETELLPLLTTRSEVLLDLARSVIGARIEAYAVPLPPSQVAAVIDTVVRLVISHIMRPGPSAEATAEHISWLCACVLAAPAPPSR